MPKALRSTIINTMIKKFRTIVFLECNKYKRLYKILDNMEKYEVLYEDNSHR